MKTPRHGAVAIAALTSTLLIAACSNAAETPVPAEEAPPAETAAAADPAASGTIVAVAQGAGSFSTLVAAVQAAGLVDTLNGAGPFTVFAPTDDAFGKVPAATRDALLAPAGRADLTKILTYHVVAGRVDAATLTRQIQEGAGARGQNAALDRGQAGALQVLGDLAVDIFLARLLEVGANDGRGV